jgi:hypothetical protein
MGTVGNGATHEVPKIVADLIKILTMERHIAETEAT